MSFKENYTTDLIKAKISANKDIAQEKKDKENSKTVVSDDAFLFAEMIEELKQEIKFMRFRR